MKRPSLKAVSKPAAEPSIAEQPQLRAVTEPTKTAQPGRVGKKVVSVYLDHSVWKDLKALSVRNETTMDALLREGIDRVFAENAVNRGA